MRTFAFASGHEGMTLAEQDKHAAAVADAKRLPRIALVESGPETTVEYHHLSALHKYYRNRRIWHLKTLMNE